MDVLDIHSRETAVMGQPTIRPRYITIEGAASYSGVSRTTIYAMIKANKIRDGYFGTRHMVDVLSIDEHFERSRDRPPASQP